MVNHFVKTLLLFIIMIFVGLLGIYLINHFNKNEQPVQLPGNIKIP